MILRFPMSHSGLSSTTKNEIYLTDSIFFNPILYREDRDKSTLTPEFLGISDNTLLTYRFAKIEIQYLCDDFGIRTQQSLANDNLPLSVIGYGRLSNTLNCFLDRMANQGNDTESTKSIKDEFCFIKKPGRKCRLVLSSTGRIGTLENVTTVKTFFQLIETPYTGNISFSDNVSWWNMNFLPKRIRMFAFKFYNNILGINTRTSHFAANPTRACTFCSMSNAPPHPDESFIHIFLNCPTIRNWHSNFLTPFFNDLQLTEDQSKKFWFLGLLPRDTNPNPSILTSILLFQYCCWEEKLRKRRPSVTTIFYLFEDIHNNIFDSSSLLRDSAASMAFSSYRPYRARWVPCKKKFRLGESPIIYTFTSLLLINTLLSRFCRHHKMSAAATPTLHEDQVAALAEEAAAAVRAAIEDARRRPAGVTAPPTPASGGFVHTETVLPPATERSKIIRINRQLNSSAEILGDTGGETALSCLENFHSIRDGRTHRSVLCRISRSLLLASDWIPGAAFLVLLRTRFCQKT
jgi:hypothetical protein